MGPAHIVHGCIVSLLMGRLSGGLYHVFILGKLVALYFELLLFSLLDKPS